MYDIAQQQQAIQEARQHHPRLLIAAHHYQRPEIVAIADMLGDSFALAKWSQQQQNADRIIFCGVRFMAEGARLLANPDQVIIHPDPHSGCPMADMADPSDIRRALSLIQKTTGKPPLLLPYMNSSVTIKAIAGETGGVVCTSSNAPVILRWALQQQRPVLFVPDEHLGRNTCRTLNVQPSVMLDPTLPDFGADLNALKQTPVILWKGYCHVHTYFTASMVQDARKAYPNCKILVHPECPEDVVMAADFAGSTDAIVAQVAQGNPGDTLVIATEVNLITRLENTFTDRTILPLKRSLCPNMYRITLPKVLASITDPRPDQTLTLSPDIIQHARKALQTMLDIA